MKLLSNALSLLLASVAFTVHCASAATGDLPPALDPAFLAGLTTLKQATGFIEDPRSSTDWKPNLQLLVGVKAVEASKRTLYFVQLTTLPPLPTNSLGQPWQPVLRTNDWTWSASNKAQFVCTLYPVRVRVFDETGRRLKEGQTPMAWGMLTNGLLDLCRLSFEEYHHDNQTNSPITRADPPIEKEQGRGAGKEFDATKLRNYDEFARATGGGFLWMIGMLYDLQTVPAVADVWAKAQCAIRRPSARSSRADARSHRPRANRAGCRQDEAPIGLQIGAVQRRNSRPTGVTDGKKEALFMRVLAGNSQKRQYKIGRK